MWWNFGTGMQGAHLLALLGGLVALAAGQEAIVADEGSSASSATAAPAVATAQPAAGGYGMHHMSGGYHSAGGLGLGSQSEYDQAAYTSSGANSGTMYIMMGVVTMSYMLLFVMLGFTCLYRPPVNLFGSAPYAQMVDIEGPKPPESALPANLAGPVAQLDAQWRKAFISKVYAILAMQLLLTVAICFSMMQFGGYRLAMWVMTEGHWTKLASLILTLVLICALMCVKNKHPHNLIVRGRVPNVHPVHVHTCA